MEEKTQINEGGKKIPWYFKKSSLVVAFLCVGPLMLPLLWTHPSLSKTRKIFWTVVISVASYFLIISTMESMKKIGEYYRQIKATMP